MGGADPPVTSASLRSIGRGTDSGLAPSTSSPAVSKATAERAAAVLAATSGPGGGSGHPAVDTGSCSTSPANTGRHSSAVSSEQSSAVIVFLPAGTAVGE